MAERKKLSLKRKEIEVEIEDTDGNVRVCILRELKGSERDAYINVMHGKMSTAKDGRVTGVKDFSGLQSSLISKSLYDETNKQIPEQTIDSWPASTQTELFKMAQELSGLGEKAEADAKNE